MEEQLALATTDSYAQAQAIYEEGAHSKSFAEVTLTDTLPGAIEKGTGFVGTNANGDEVRGVAMEAAPTGATTLKVQYAVSDMQASYVNCQVGALGDDGNTEGCKFLFPNPHDVSRVAGLTFLWRSSPVRLR